MLLLHVDEARAAEWRETGIAVRALRGTAYGSFDIAWLDTNSLKEWVRERSHGNPEFAVNLVCMLLSHET